MAYDPWDARIERVDNGYIVYLCPSSSPDNDGPDVYVFEEEDSEHGELEALASAFRNIQDHFGKGGSKHDAKRLWVKVE
jgi:hypothetical protein